MEKGQKGKSYQARRVSTHARNITKSKWNSFPNRNNFFGDQPQRATWTDSWTIKPLCSSEWKGYQVRTERISWNNFRYGSQ